MQLKFINTFLVAASARRLEISHFQRPGWQNSQTTSCNPISWTSWTKNLDCFWPTSNQQYWYTGKVGSATGTSQWKNWRSENVNRLESNIDHFHMLYYYDTKKQAVCLPGGDTLSMSKVKYNTQVTNCTQPAAAYQKDFNLVRHHDAVYGSDLTNTAVNFASIYNDKVTQSSSEANANGHTWLYGDFINYDHLPAKSTYAKNCDGRGGKSLPTVAIMAIDHKGPVWSFCTTSRSLSSDNSRQTMEKMTEYIALGQYGRAIFENLDCLLQAAVDYNMIESFTDYHYGFVNLVYLHFEAHTINENERDTLIRYLNEVQASPVDANGHTSYWDDILRKQDTNWTPLFC